MSLFQGDGNYFIDGATIDCDEISKNISCAKFPWKKDATKNVFNCLHLPKNLKIVFHIGTDT